MTSCHSSKSRNSGTVISRIEIESVLVAVAPPHGCGTSPHQISPFTRTSVAVDAGVHPEVQRLVSLGPVRADGTYDLPAGLDPAAFPIVDVSGERIDGDPTHSGDSVLRGQLTF